MVQPLKVGDYVNQLNTKNPTGIIEAINGHIAEVRWGTADKRTFRDSFRLDELQIVTEPIYSPDDVVKRQMEEAGGHILEEE